MAELESVSNLYSTIISRSAKTTKIEWMNSSKVLELPACRTLTFNKNGDFLAISDSQGVRIVSTEDYEKPLWQVAKPKTVEVKFSPLAKYLAIWEPVSKDKTTETVPCNLHVYNWRENKLVMEVVHRKQSDWSPQWTSNEFLCSRLANNSDILFYEDHNFSQVKCKLHMPKIMCYSLAASPASYHVVISVLGSKGEPSFVRLYKYPNFSSPSDALANKSFFKAERTELYWNNEGTSLLTLTFSDNSEESYYGEQHLHYISTKQESCQVHRAKPGPIYSIAWHPNSKEFCVVYGLMPAKATLYNLKCEPVFDFGTAPRNLAYFNPFGNLLCLAGFGNLNGGMEFWDVEKHKMLNKFSVVDTTYFEWCPDGVHFLAATLSPRLRVSNGLKIWHYSGIKLRSWETNELYSAIWKPVKEGTHTEPTLKFTASQAAVVSATATAKPAAYVPPALRNKMTSSTSGTPAATSAAVYKPKFREDYELPSNLKEQENKPMSKSAMKNKKKRDNKKAKKLGSSPEKADDDEEE
ncbi:hypothetical protein HELRODRAFT_192345 [Helobdella robusta]|uniref:Eukaryotic translation initiation factor 2A n=1 Tax=Helobdella robusta TaxID=6412 RepID=T1FTU6_HELRO|nr:hypothetical protein HELRODRAFT_192345 [Helobdella robusta]ESO01460.1 hypothetical protein HELRODRAFT_192345 [Helobdella robusta]